MYRRHFPVFFIITLLLFFFYHTTNVFSKELSYVDSPSNLYAKSALLMDGHSHRVLFEKEGETVLPMASTTKIMTCLYALEHGNLTDVVTFSKRAASAPKTHLGVSAGSQFLLSDLLYAIMLESSNDAAIAIAEHIDGSVENFCKNMTLEARSFGCKHTSFITPNGLDDKNHYTTCKDLAIITCHALENTGFRSIISEKDFTIKELSSGKSTYLSNKNAFLTSYPGAIGVKTGYTSQSGYCFVGAVEQGERLFVSVVLGCGWYPNRSYKWKDTRKLADYGINNYQPTTVSLKEQTPGSISLYKGQKKSCLISPSSDISFLARPDEVVSVERNLPNVIKAPVKKNQTIGSFQIKINNKTYTTAPITAAESVPAYTYSYCCRILLKAFVHA